MSDKEPVTGSKYDLAKRLALGGAVVAGAAIAFGTFVSAYDSGTRSKRKHAEVVPAAIDGTATALKRVFFAMDNALSSTLLS